MEERFKLSDKQFESLTDAQRQVDSARFAYESALRHANAVGDLVKDFHGIVAESANVSVDNVAREIIVKIPSPPAQREPKDA